MVTTKLLVFHLAKKIWSGTVINDWVCTCSTPSSWDVSLVEFLQIVSERNTRGLIRLTYHGIMMPNL